MFFKCTGVGGFFSYDLGRCCWRCTGACDEKWNVSVSLLSQLHDHTSWPGFMRTCTWGDSSKQQTPSTGTLSRVVSVRLSFSVPCFDQALTFWLECWLFVRAGKEKKERRWSGNMLEVNHLGFFFLLRIKNGAERFWL